MENYWPKTLFCHPDEGWAIFNIAGYRFYPEVERLDDLEIIKNDDEAKSLALKRGFEFNHEDPYRVSNIGHAVTSNIRLKPNEHGNTDK